MTEPGQTDESIYESLRPIFKACDALREATEAFHPAITASIDALRAALADRGAALDQARRDGAAEALREAANAFQGSGESFTHSAVAVLLRARAAALAEQGDGA